MLLECFYIDSIPVPFNLHQNLGMSVLSGNNDGLVL